MFKFEIIKIFLFCFYLIIHIKSQLYPYYHQASFDEDDKETSTYSIGTDFGPCPCDLHRGLCDFDCCCDKDCNDDQKKKFNFECDEYYHEKFINDKFRCQNIKKTFNYYLNRPHEKNVYSYNNNEDLNKYNDQIFGLMCMVYDRTGDIGEFYVHFDGNAGNKLNELHDEYNKYFSSQLNEDDSIYVKNKDNDNIKEIYLYKSDPFGNCVRTLYRLDINSSKPIENIECRMKNNDQIQEQKNYITELLNEYQCTCDNCFILSNKTNTNIADCNNYITNLSNHTIKELHITFRLNLEEDNNNVFNIQEIIIRSLLTDSTNRIKQKFSLNFVTSDYNIENFIKSGLPGYLINKPVLFKQGDIVYERIQIQGADPTDGSCLLKSENINNLNDPFILFKVNNIYSCKLGKVSYYDLTNPEEIQNYKIFNNFLKDDNIRFGKYGFINDEDSGKVNNWTLINITNEENTNCVESGNIRCLPITQYLVIIFSKFGKKGSSQEYIYDMKLITKYEPIEFDFENLDNDYKDIELKFIVKFVSLNEEQFLRDFENDNYKTSLIPLPEDVKYPEND